ncbi:MAG: glycosyltransferase family 1 protein [Gemmatimonadales bacterium]|nr:MAG: glycosyltransferase family 1 protein [Gemmatimonadales bacterium]
MDSRDHLLFVADHPSDTRYAWDFISAVCGGVAARLAPAGVRTTIAYPELVDGPVPPALEGLRRVQLPWRGPPDLPALCRFVREEGVTALYITDRVARDPAYARLRRAGARTIILHDHTSGLRTRPGPLKAALKRARLRIPGTSVDLVIAVSRFVARRHLEVELLPPEKVEVVWNSVEVPPQPADAALRAQTRARFGIPPHALLVASASRATEAKGIQHLLRAFDALPAGAPGDPPVHLLYLGDGVYLDRLKEARNGMSSAERIHLPGYMPDARAILGVADIAVVPSRWAEAFGLAALEPLAWGVPVIASRTGGLPEVVRDGVDGILVEPGDEPGLTRAMADLLADPERRISMGRQGRERASGDFHRERQLDRLVSRIAGLPGLGGSP